MTNAQKDRIYTKALKDALAQLTAVIDRFGYPISEQYRVRCAEVCLKLAVRSMEGK